MKNIYIYSYKITESGKLEICISTEDERRINGDEALSIFFEVVNAMKTIGKRIKDEKRAER